MKERINDKIMQIERFLGELEPIMPGDLEEYEKDLKAKAACERYFEKIIDACIDLVFLVIRHKRLRIPEFYKENIRGMEDEREK